LSAGQRQQLRERVRREAVKAVGLRELRREMERQMGGGQGLGGDVVGEAFLEVVATAYRPPWQLAVQHWLDAVVPGPRTFARPSRRCADRDDIVLPGRKREGWTLHIVLDTSGSMTHTLPHVLGLIASFCEGAGVSDVHVIQCDVGVTSDDWVDVSALSRFRVAGFGGSDMSPAMERLAADPEVAAVLVLTDGYIDYPHHEPPYAMLWGWSTATRASARPPGRWFTSAGDGATTWLRHTRRAPFSGRPPLLGKSTARPSRTSRPNGAGRLQRGVEAGAGTSRSGWSATTMLSGSRRAGKRS
jgi:hypothetical protein